VKLKLPKPYFEDEWVRLYHGDAWTLLGYSDLVYDALVTDTPYGLNLGVGNDRRPGHGLGKREYDVYRDTPEHYTERIVPIVEHCIAQALKGRAGVFAGPRFQEMPRTLSVGGVYVPNASALSSWGFTDYHPVLFYGKAWDQHLGARHMTLESCATAPKSDHPCPKPLEWMEWLVSRVAAPDDVILDPFAGTGQTLKAARKLGRKSIGFEISERYCELAAANLAQGVLLCG